MSPPFPRSSRAIDGGDISKHDTKMSCWIVVDSDVYDVTAYLDRHPGGAAILLKQGGQDATAEFSKIRSPELLQSLPKTSYIGSIVPSTESVLKKPRVAAESSESAQAPGAIPHLKQCVATTDFEPVAKRVMTSKSWIYASATSSAGQSMRANLDHWSAITFRPRVLRDVTDISTVTNILGYKSPLPFFVSSMGTLGSAHGGAEPELVRGLARRGVHAVISTASTRPAEEIAEAAAEAKVHFHEKGAVETGPSARSLDLGTLFFQFYIPSDKQRALQLIQKVKDAGYKGLFITVDAPVLGKRTIDRRLQADEEIGVGLADDNRVPEAQESVGKADEKSENKAGDNTFAPAFGGRPVPGQLSSGTTWDDLAWIRDAWQGPIVLKGIQCADDVKLAFRYGCEGVLLSNHGGRQMNSSPSALMTLLEIREYCPGVLGKIDIFVDGGLRDGADVLKALCLGATAVGVGRPLMYALAGYGAKGVERCIEILVEELEIGMRLLGITAVDQARPDMVNARRLVNELWRPEKARL